MINDDTDIEADDGFKDYSEVTLETNMDNREKENIAKPMTREKKRENLPQFHQNRLHVSRQ